MLIRFDNVISDNIISTSPVQPLPGNHDSCITIQQTNMIKLLDEDNSLIRIFDTEEQLFSFLQERLHDMGDDDISTKRKQNWQFVRYPYKRLSMFLEHMPEESINEKSFVHMGLLACQHQIDMLEICTGDWEKPNLFIVTPTLNIAALKRDWSKLFCKAHGMGIRIG